ncbi:MAG TPA: (Fe-S)-binding protein [Aggregatilineaceae bacterium]|nr:(Fe-S)-binding protein [Aggregatilineaceae bacterium]
MSQRVALFVTCLVDQIMPEVGVAAVKLLRRAGCQVDFPSEQTCCGQPFFNSGFRDQAAKLAQRTIAIFEDYDAVVLPSGSCAAMIRQEYPHLLEPWPGWRTRAELLAAKTFELGEFLVHQASWEPRAAAHAPRVTYHDSCHMNRMLHLKQEPRTLLTASGCTIVEMDESERCCGFGGLFSVRIPQVSNAMTTEKLRLAKLTETDLLVTSDPGCLMQMRGLAHQMGVRAEHLAVVLEELTR